MVRFAGIADRYHQVHASGCLRLGSDRSARGPNVKTEWVNPAMSEVIPVSEAKGNGGAGFDFASEASN